MSAATYDREYEQAYRVANREAILANKRKFRSNNREKIRLENKAYYKANRNKERSRKVRWRARRSEYRARTRVDLHLEVLSCVCPNQIWTLTELADFCECNVSVMSKRLYRALAEIRTEIDRRGITEELRTLFEASVQRAIRQGYVS